MQVCVFGCGAIGGLLAAHLAKTGAPVTVFDRGEQLQALRSNGLTLHTPDGDVESIRSLRVLEDPGECGTFDVVFLAVKAHEIPPLSDVLPRLFHANTALVTLQNGLPWWYFQRHGGEFGDYCMKAVDPDRKLFDAIDPAHIVGCVAFPAAEVSAAGVVRHIEGIRFPVGELDGGASERVSRISELLVVAGLKSPVLEDIRSEIWLKSWGNLAFNPISALTHATMAEIALHPNTRQYVVQVMTEAQTVADKLGVSFRVPLERRLQGAERVGSHKTSMLQDLLAQRPLELDAILGTVIEMAELTGTEVPALEGLYALCSLRNETNQGRSVNAG